MLTIYGEQRQFCDGVTRRDFLKIGGLALGGLSLSGLLAAEAEAGIRSSHKAIIMVYLPGGPPHLDMVDLKPDAPAEIRGPYKPAATTVPGVRIAELQPRLAGLAHPLERVLDGVATLQTPLLQAIGAWRLRNQRR